MKYKQERISRIRVQRYSEDERPYLVLENDDEFIGRVTDIINSFGDRFVSVHYITKTHQITGETFIAVILYKEESQDEVKES